MCNNQLATSNNACYGRYCLDIDIAKSYCICQFDKVGETCSEDKPGRCLFGNGNMQRFDVPLEIFFLVLLDLLISIL